MCSSYFPHNHQKAPDQILMNDLPWLTVTGKFSSMGKAYETAGYPATILGSRN